MNRGNLVALLLVAGLGAFFYVHDVKGGKERKTKETQEKRYFPDQSGSPGMLVTWKEGS